MEDTGRRAGALPPHPSRPGAVPDLGSEAGLTYRGRWFLSGEDLSGLVARATGGMPIDATADIRLAVCAGVFAAPDAGVIHRDLNPQNIFLAQTAIGGLVPK